MHCYFTSLHELTWAESCRGNKLLILTANSSTSAPSGTPTSIWSIRGWGSLSKLHTSTLFTSTKTGNIGYSHQFTLCTTNREGRPSFSVQIGAGQQRLQESCLPVHKFKFFYCNIYLSIYQCVLEQGRDMWWRSREDKFKKQSNFSASKKLVAQVTSLASDLPFQAALATCWLQKSRLFVNHIKYSNHLRCSKARLQGWGLWSWTMPKATQLCWKLWKGC